MHLLISVACIVTSMPLWTFISHDWFLLYAEYYMYITVYTNGKKKLCMDQYGININVINTNIVMNNEQGVV